MKKRLGIVSNSLLLVCGDLFKFLYLHAYNVHNALYIDSI